MADNNIPYPSEIIDKPAPAAPPPPKKVRAFKVFNGREYRVFTSSQMIATEILTMGTSQDVNVSVLMLDPTRCDLSKLFDDGGYIASPKNIE